MTQDSSAGLLFSKIVVHDMSTPYESPESPQRMLQRQQGLQRTRSICPPTSGLDTAHYSDHEVLTEERGAELLNDRRHASSVVQASDDIAQSCNNVQSLSLSMSLPSSARKEARPEPRTYGPSIVRSGMAAKELVKSVFQENLQRAKDRNGRAKDLDAVLQNSYASEREKRNARTTLMRQENSFLRDLRIPEGQQNFRTIQVIGKGAFGVVRLVRRKRDGQIYALKSMRKLEMLENNQLAHVRAERDILARSKDNPWLVKLYSSFQDSYCLYLVMEFLPGGDLMTLLIHYEVFSEDITRFYVAELVTAVEAVHNLGFLHRWA